jgi:hypothetical protein
MIFDIILIMISILTIIVVNIYIKYFVKSKSLYNLPQEEDTKNYYKYKEMFLKNSLTLMEQNEFKELEKELDKFIIRP